MSENSPIKDALYAKIEEIGQEQVHNLLLKKEFSKLFEVIYEKALDSIEEDVDEYEKFGTLAESFTHYLFTEMLIPSQRKISYKNMELDMIIPNVTELKKNIENVVLIFFVKTSNMNEIKQRVLELKKIQNVDVNIWIISKDQIKILQKSYLIEKISFGEFLRDAQNFVNARKMNKLNIFKTKV